MSVPKKWREVALDRRKLTLGEKNFLLFPAEARVLAALIAGEGRVVGHDELVRAASPGKVDTGWSSGSRNNLINVVASLRKLGLTITASKGRGYRLVAGDVDSLAVAFARVRVALAELERTISHVTKERML